MLKDIVHAEAQADCILFLRFEDGVEGIVDVRDCVPFVGIFAPLSDASFFSQAAVNAEFGTVVWPNGADLDPDVLYSRLAGESGRLAG